MKEFDCNIDELEALVRGDLDAERKARLERHLAGCPSCVDELAWLRAEGELLRERNAHTPRARTDLMWAGIEARIGTSRLPEARPRWWRALWPARLEPRWFAIGAGGALAVAAVLLVILRAAPTAAPERAASGNASSEQVANGAPAPRSREKTLAAALDSIDEAEAAELAAITALQELYDEQRHSLDRATVAAIDAQIARYQDAVAKMPAVAHQDFESRLRLLDARAEHRRAMQTIVYRLEEKPR